MLKKFVKKLIPIKVKKILMKKVIPWLFYFIPVKKNVIVFNNFNGKGFGCNPKYIAEAIKKTGVNLHMIWLISNNDEYVPEYIEKVPWGSYRFYQSLATAKVIISNVKNYLPFKKKEGQIYIQTEHGGYALKKAEGMVIEKLSKEYIEESIENSRITDFFISNSTYFSDELRTYYWCTCPIWETGLPRNDILINNDKDYVNNIKIRMGLEGNIKYLLYAPTFRDDYDIVDCYLIDVKRIVKSLNNRSGDRWKILIRFHPNLKDLNLYDKEDDVVDVTGYADMQELLVVADALLTDYSGCLMDYSLTGKPILIYANDYDEYLGIRGLKDLYYKLKYPKAKTIDELCVAIDTYDVDYYKNYSKEIARAYLEFDRGDAADKIAYNVISLLKN